MILISAPLQAVVVAGVPLWQGRGGGTASEWRTSITYVCSPAVAELFSNHLDAWTHNQEELQNNLCVMWYLSPLKTNQVAA